MFGAALFLYDTYYLARHSCPCPHLACARFPATPVVKVNGSLSTMLSSRGLHLQLDEKLDPSLEEENEDIENGVSETTTAEVRAARPPTAEEASRAAFIHQRRSNDNGPSDGSGGGGRIFTSDTVRRSSSSWSERELINKAEEHPRVKVTPAWRLNAALGAMHRSSPSISSSLDIVQQVATSQCPGLVLCGCAGSGQVVVGSGTGERGGRPAQPVVGAYSMHGKWPSIARAKYGGQNSVSPMTRSWHGKSRHHARGQMRQNAAGRGMPSAQLISRAGGLASAVDVVITNALEDLVGDVAGKLVGSDGAPAVLAVRASQPVKSTNI